MELEEIKLYLKIDVDDDDDFLRGLLISSEQYLENAGCAKNYENELYKLAVKLLISHWYENRCITGNLEHLKYSLESIIVQLKETKINA